MSSWQSYSSIFSVGHRAVRDLLNYPHIVEEKIDGSQFSFGVFESDPVEGEEWLHEKPPLELRVRSKGCIMITDAPEKMFNKAVESVKSIQHLLHPGWTYRGEYLAKPKHNTLAYDRVPKGNVILFDVGVGDNEWLGPKEKAEEAARIGLECVPVLNEEHVNHDGTGDSYYRPATLETMRTLLDTKQSVLGGQLIEGVVIKPLVPLFDEHTKKTLMAKFVSERFKEAHKEAWKVTSPNSGDVLEQLTKRYKVEGRWLKALQHLRDDGKLQDAPQDIPLLLNEIQKDLGKEEKEEIQKLLWKWAWPSIARSVTRGVPEWYKESILLKKQFEGDEIDGSTDTAIRPETDSGDRGSSVDQGDAEGL